MPRHHPNTNTHKYKYPNTHTQALEHACTHTPAIVNINLWQLNSLLTLRR